ncbi:hypothetical protein RB595_009388 [Gaeumannomyces hyphopodioides]
MAPSTIILITGANVGVGFASAKVIASASDKYHVFVTGRSLEKAQNAVAKLEATGELKGTVSPLQLDVTDLASVDAAVAAVDAKFGRLDVLVNNGAVGMIKNEAGEVVADASVEDTFRAVLATNVAGPYTASRKFRPLLAKSADPRIVHISSGMGSIAGTPALADAYKHFGEAGMPYAVSKAALNMLSVVERTVFSEQKTKIFVMCPGFVVSELRGSAEDARTGWGGAGDPAVSGETLLTVIEGKRDADEGKGILHKDGVYPW